MSLMNAFRRNTSGFAKTSLLTAGLALAGQITPANAQKQDTDERKGYSYAGYFGLSRVSSEAMKNYDPYQTGTVLTIQGQAPFSDKATSPLRHVGLLGKYEYYFADPNQITMSWQYQHWNQTGQAHYSSLPSRATLGVYGQTPTQYRLGAKGFVGATMYPGGQRVWLNSAHLATAFEVNAKIFSPKSRMNIEMFASVNHMVYNQNWFSNRWRPEDKKSTTYLNFGARIGLYSNPD